MINVVKLIFFDPKRFALFSGFATCTKSSLVGFSKNYGSHKL